MPLVGHHPRPSLPPSIAYELLAACVPFDDHSPAPPAAQTRLLKHRFAELQRAVPSSVEPSQLIGAAVLRRFDGHGVFSGTVVEYDDSTGFRVQYSDGDAEDLTLRELRALLLREGLAPPPHLPENTQSIRQPTYTSDHTLARPRSPMLRSDCPLCTRSPVSSRKGSSRLC